jgi:hypothetical protein
VVKVSSNTSLLGTPTLNQLYTNALHIGLWNSIENDFIIIAACLPSVRPLLKACRVFTGAHLGQLTASKPTHAVSASDSQHSLKDGGVRDSDEENMLELGAAKHPPLRKHRSIQVVHEFSMQSDRVEPGAPSMPSYYGLR